MPGNLLGAKEKADGFSFGIQIRLAIYIDKV